MVRFSCFQAQSPSEKHKKTVHQSSETMQKILEDSSHNQTLRSTSYLKKEINPNMKEEGEKNEVFELATDYSPTASEEMDAKYITDNDNDNGVHKKALFKKSQSLGSGLNWKHRTSGDEGSQDETEQRFSYDVNKYGLNSDQFPEPIPYDAAQVGSDFAKNISTLSFEDPQPSEKEDTDKDEVYLSDDLTPRIHPGIVKSTSLPTLASPYRCSISYVARSRSAENLYTLDSTKQGMNAHETGRQGQYQERDSNSVFNNDKNGENLAEKTEYTCKYVGSAKDWIVPASDGDNKGKCIVRESSSMNLDEVPAKDFRLKRIEEWVINLQHCGLMEESNESDTPCYDELSEGNVLLEEPTAVKSEVKVNPGMETAKRYISSLNASATAAQLTNLGLVVIPFLSAFVSLKALNLSGNAIGRVAAGALPRGLHVLNLSKNNISTIEGLRDLTRLRVLDLSYNRILRIGHGLAACPSLKELYLAGNKISEVEGLHRLLKLNVLDLRFNKISTTKCLGQLAANYNCLQVLSLEGNPAQKNVGEEQLKKYVQSLLPQLTYYNRQSIKVGTMKDSTERSARLGIGSHQVDRGFRMEGKNVRKGAHGIVSQKGPSSSSHGRKSQAAAGTSKMTRSRHGRLPPSGIKMSAAAHGQQISELSSKPLSLRDDFTFPRSRSEGNLGAL